MYRVGFGWDLHSLAPGVPLLLGGVGIPGAMGSLAHSDGDVLLHALIDALLGAACLDDIGTHFPPQDQRWKDADSVELLRRTMELVGGSGYQLGNVDSTIVLEKPNLAPYKGKIRHSIANEVGISVSEVSVKAKTREGLGSVGRGEAIEAFVTVLLVQGG